jgi:4-alpha-glucanotransferase
MLSTHDTTNWAAWWENEAGTVDEALFIRKCSDRRQINFENVKAKLFDLKRSVHGRLRWLNQIDSVDKLVDILNQGLSPKGTVPKEHLLDFIDLYENSFREKEKLWKHFKIKGPMREKFDAEIVHAALKLNLDSSAIFSIQLITDWLYLADIFKGDPYQYRVNTPGTISAKNWSQLLPISLEKLLKHKVTKQIRKMIADSARLVTR